jgi:hypothetical protein
MSANDSSQRLIDLPLLPGGNEVWQLVGPDDWKFGTLIRGVVRHCRAEIYFHDGEGEGQTFGWIWIVLGWRAAGKPQRGKERSLMHALQAAEEALGLVDGDRYELEPPIAEKP